MVVSARLNLFVFAVLVSATTALGQGSPGPEQWSAYGGDLSGQRYSRAQQITPANVSKLALIWQYHTKALRADRANRSDAAFEATPILAKRTLYLSTPFDKVVALDAASGAEHWRYDPHLPSSFLAGVYTSRGVAYWRGVNENAACAERVFLATLDARLISLDAKSGAPCQMFGRMGLLI